MVETPGEFTRNGRRRITGFTIQSGRVRNLRVVGQR